MNMNKKKIGGKWSSWRYQELKCAMCNGTLIVHWCNHRPILNSFLGNHFI